MLNSYTRAAHGEYLLQTLLYIVRLVNQGNEHQVINWGLTQDQAQRIRTMSMDDLHTLVMSMHTHVLNLTFDSNALELAFESHQRRCRERQQIRQFIEAGASFPIMAKLYGLHKSEFTQLRRHLKLSEQDTGRYSLPDTAQQILIWNRWLHHANLADKERLLAVHHDTQIKIRAIWGLLQEWRQSGLLSPTNGNLSRVDGTLTQPRFQ